MSRFRLPTEKGIELFPKVIQQPVRVRFDSTAPGTPEARAMFNALQGKINQFYDKSAQAYSLGVIEQAARHYSEPGLKMDYQNNQGVETIYVKVSPAFKKRLLEQQTNPLERVDIPPVMVIDIFFKVHPVRAVRRWELSGTPDGGITYPDPPYLFERYEQQDRFAAEAFLDPEADDPEYAISVPEDPDDTPLVYPFQDSTQWHIRFAESLPQVGEVGELRTFALDEDPGPDWLYSLAVRPRLPGDEMTIDLHAMAWNLTGESDPPPGTDGVMSDWEFTFFDSVEVRLRVREMVATRLGAVEENRFWTGRDLGESEGGPFDNEFPVERPVQFVAGANFTIEEHDEIADPDNPGMGKVLEDTGWHSVTLNHPSDGQIHLDPDPDDPFTDKNWGDPRYLGDKGLMQKFATVTYRPALSVDKGDSEVEIEFV